MDTTFTWYSVKNASYVVAFIVASGFLGFAPQSLAILIALMIVDVITGVTRSLVVNGGVSVKSSIGIKGILAKILILTAIFSFALAAKGLGLELGSGVQGIITVFILAETYSVIGNVHSALTGKPKSEFDAVAYLLKKTRELLDSITAK